MSTLHVSTVEFRKNIYKYLKQLPIAVTSKGKVVFYVSTVAPLELSTVNKEVSTLNGGKQENLEDKIDVELNKEYGWCQLHFEKGVEYPLTLIT